MISVADQNILRRLIREELSQALAGVIPPPVELSAATDFQRNKAAALKLHAEKQARRAARATVQ